MAPLAAILLASLTGSLHCVGMCGPLVAFAVGSTESHSNLGRLALHFAYHGGRLVTYAAIGAVCGLLGAALDMGGAMVGLNRAAAILAGVMMIGVGVIAILRYRGVRLPERKTPGPLRRWIVLGQRAATGLRPLPRAGAIGLLTGFLPCGWLYAFAIVAAGSGSLAWGASVMAAFWMGTVPVLAALGIGVQTLTGTLGRRVPLVTAVALVALGLYTIASRSTVPVAAFEAQAESLQGSGTAEQLDSIQQTVPPCCQPHAQ